MPSYTYVFNAFAKAGGGGVLHRFGCVLLDVGSEVELLRGFFLGLFGLLHVLAVFHLGLRSLLVCLDGFLVVIEKKCTRGTNPSID